VSIRLASRRSAVVGLAVTTVIAGGVAAYAYPPQSPMEVSATATATGPTTGTISVTVANANPSCGLSIRVDGATPREQELSPGVTTATFTGVTGDRDHDVRVRTISCTKGSDKEHARTSVVVPRGQAVPQGTAQYKSYFRVDVSGVQNDTEIVLTATPPAGSPVQDVDTANSRGEGNVKVRLNQHGTWSIVVTADGATIGSFNPNV
jgi:hypothetical protein